MTGVRADGQRDTEPGLFGQLLDGVIPLRQQFRFRYREKVKMVEFSGIKNLEKIIKENFIKEYRTSLLKDFEEDYKILNRQIMDFANK